jgi:hypothetical protein
MRNKRRQFVRPRSRQVGVTLTEMMVVIGIAALMLGLAIPTANVLLNSFESESGAKSIISSALASARAIAAKEQRYAGIRFQKMGDPNNPEKASQYIIFIIQDPNIDNVFGYGYRAVEGIQPIKLPDSIGVMDMTIVTQRNKSNPINPTEIRIDDPVSGGDSRINDNFELLDTSAFSIIFSPSGKLVIQGVRVWNRNGRTDNLSSDDVFNTIYNVESTRIAMLYQDDYWIDPVNNFPPNWGLGPEPSRNSFIIYDTKLFKEAYKNGNAYSGYLNQLKMIYINPYTGTIINEK